MKIKFSEKKKFHSKLKKSEQKYLKKNKLKFEINAQYCVQNTRNLC